MSDVPRIGPAPGGGGGSGSGPVPISGVPGLAAALAAIDTALPGMRPHANTHEVYDTQVRTFGTLWGQGFSHSFAFARSTKHILASVQIPAMGNSSSNNYYNGLFTGIWLTAYDADGASNNPYVLWDSGQLGPATQGQSRAGVFRFSFVAPIPDGFHSRVDIAARHKTDGGTVTVNSAALRNSNLGRTHTVLRVEELLAGEVLT